MIATININATTVENTKTRFYNLNVFAKTLSLTILPGELTGFIYYPGSINLRPFEAFKTAVLETAFKLQELASPKYQKVLPKFRKPANDSIILLSAVTINCKQTGFKFS